MAEMYVLNARTRSVLGKKASRKLWREGKLPAVFYHKGEENLYLELDQNEVKKFLNKDHGVIELNIDNGKLKKSCIVKEIQFDPVKGFPSHIDFQGVVAGEKVRAKVHVLLEGTPAGIKMGGFLEHFIRELEVEALPKDLPEHITIDVSHLNIGDSLHVKDIKTDKFKILDNEDEVICTVQLPKVHEAVEAPAEQEEAEPEVIKQKKVEEE